MKNYCFFVLILCANICLGQNGEKYSISQDSKGKYLLTNNQSKVVVFKKCETIEGLAGPFENTDSSWRDLLVVRQDKMLTIFSQRSDSVVFKYECEEYIAKELEDDNQPNQNLPKKLIIYFELKIKNKDNPVNILINTKTAKAVAVTGGYYIYATFTSDRNFIKMFDSNTLSKPDVQIKDLNGKIIVPYTNGRYFQECTSGFIVQNSEPLFREKCGVIDKQGKITVPFIYHRITATFGDYIIAEDTLKKVGIINSQNKIIVPFEYRSEEWLDGSGWPQVHYIFSNDGMFVLRKSTIDGDFVLVDTNNIILVPAGTYMDISMFDNDVNRYFEVKGKNGLMGVYDSRLRKEIIPCEYKFFRNSLCTSDGGTNLLKQGYREAEKNERWGLLNFNTGNVQIPFEYDLEDPEFVETEQSKFFYLTKEGKRGSVGLTGETLIPFEYDDIQMIPGFYIVKRKGLYGLVDGITYQEVLPLEYSKITYELKVEKTEGDIIKKGVFTKERTIIWDK